MMTAKMRKSFEIFFVAALMSMWLMSREMMRFALSARSSFSKRRNLIALSSGVLSLCMTWSNGNSDIKSMVK